MNPLRSSETLPVDHSKAIGLGNDAPAPGDFAALEKRGKIRQWMEDIDQIDNFHTRASVAGTEPYSVISSEDSRYSQNAGGSTAIGSDIDTPPRKSTPGLDSLLDDDFDSEDDFFVDAALSALEKGRKSFDANDYTAADTYLREALVMIKDLARKQQSVCDTWDLRRMLGVCAFHVHSAADAEDALVSVLENATKSTIPIEGQRLHVSEVAHLLAQVDVKLGKLDKAYRYCEFSLRGKRKVLGKTHEESYDSLALMARILELQNNPIRAEFFVGMIPEPQRQVHIHRFLDLSVQEKSPTIAASEILPSDAVSSVAIQMPSASGEKVIAPQAPAPKISQRSPSPVSMSPPRSTVSISRGDELARPVSALSRETRLSDTADTRTVSSVSAAGSPDALAAALGSLPPQFVGDNQLQVKPKGLERPDNIRSHSNNGSVTTDSLPAISEPSSPSSMQEQLNMFPHPLRLQQQQPRRAVISELPGDNQYGQVSSHTARNKRGKHSASRLPDPPRSIPASIDMSREHKPVAPSIQAQPSLSDRDLLPSRVAQVSPPTSSPGLVPNNGPVHHDNSTDRLPKPLQGNFQPSAQSAVAPSTRLVERSELSSPTIPGSRSETAGEYSSHASSHSNTLTISPPLSQPPERAPPVYEDFATPEAPQPAPPVYQEMVDQPSSQSASIVPDAQRSDFQNSAWTPPVQQHPNASHGNLPFMPPTNYFSGQSSAPPLPLMPDNEREAQYVSPGESHAAERRSITSSSYSEPTSTIQSHPTSHPTVPSVGTGFSQESGKSKRKPSLLKAFRGHSSTSATTFRSSSLTYNGIRLTRSDMDSIKNDTLTDAVIDFWQEHLEQELLQRSAKFFLMRPMRSALFHQSHDDPANLQAALPDLNTGDGSTLHIFIPLAHPKRPSHRSLLLISPNDGLACHYDSRQPWNRSTAENLTTRISTHLNKPLEFYEVGDVPQILNDKDSAVFMCMFMQHLILKLQNTHVSKKVNAGLECRVDAKSARKTLTKLIEARKKSGQVIVE